MPIRFPRNFFSRILLAAFLVFSATSAARAQEAQSSSINELAAKMAAAISASKQKNVIVPDFVGPSNRMTALGRTLAEEFSVAIARDNAKIKVLDRSGISQMVQKNNLGPLYMVFVPCNSWIATGLKAKSCVSGNIFTKGDTQVLEVTLFHLGHFEKIAEFSSPISLTPEMQEAGGKTIFDDPILGYPRGGVNGFTMPACLVCHFAYFTDAAVKHKTQGAVTLAVVVGENGNVEIIKVLKPLPDGLTDSAVQAVQGWTFKPGTGPDGNFATVTVPIEVQFHLHRW